MRPGGRLGLQNRMWARLRAWVGSIPMHSRHYAARLDFRIEVQLVIHSKILARALVILAATLVPGTVASAQDTTTATPRVTPDTLKPPISPGKAFLHSLIFPGSAQNKLGRNRVAAGIIAVEAMSIAMIRESGADVREARRQLGDSLVISYVDNTGNKLSTPTLERRRFGDDEVSSRRSHMEDWIALLVANHLFAASEAFVAASLWDVNARVTLSGNRSNFQVGARIEW